MARTESINALEHFEWILRNPCLVEAEQFGYQTFCLPSENELDELLAKAEGELANYLSNTKSHFLGAYYEKLWAFFFEHSKRYELLYNGLQIHGNGKTLGEFDFIVHDKQSQRYLHIETAIKFYLGTDDHCIESEHTKNWLWCGPRAIDRLDLKVNKLVTQQLKLSESEQGKATLKSLRIDEVVPTMLLQGHLCPPMLDLAKDWQSKLPQYAKSNNKTASWLRRSAAIDYLKQQRKVNNHLWKVLSKKEWLCMLSGQDEKEAYFKTDELIARLEETYSGGIHYSPKEQGSILVAEVDERTYTELQRIFVVQDNWPNNHN